MINFDEALTEMAGNFEDAFSTWSEFKDRARRLVLLSDQQQFDSMQTRLRRYFGFEYLTWPRRN